MPDTLSRLIAQASIVVGRGTFVATTGFLWVEDANVREMFDFPNDMKQVPAEANYLNNQILVRYYEREWKDIAR